ncbi:hypothetical protein IKQ26_04055 [bacterium]|nr:hypothetical protein [bacterium]
MRKLRVLVAGADSTTYTILKYLQNSEPIEALYTLPANEMLSGMCELVDIKENDIGGIIGFAKEKQIDLTIVTSQILIVNGIADAFEQNGLTIFAPKRESAIVTYFNGAAKKTMYKLKIPTTRFAIFDKLPNALAYLRQMHFPVYVEPDFKILTEEKKEYQYYSQAKQAIDDLFYDGEERVVVEENNPAWRDYNLYFLTDGYSAYLVGTTEYDENEIAVSPIVSMSQGMINHIKHNVVLKLIDDIRNFSSEYSGILGVKIKSDGRIYKVIDFMSTFDKYDLETILPTLKNDLLELFYSSATGSLSDEFKNLSYNSLYACSILTDTKPSVEVQSYTMISEDIGIVTTVGSTVTKAKEKLQEALSSDRTIIQQ